MPVIVFTGITRNNTDVVSRNSSGITLNDSALNPLVINPGDVMHFYYKAASNTSSNAYNDCWGEYGNNGSITCCGIKIVVDNGGVFTQNWAKTYSNLKNDGVVIDYSNTIMENMFWSSYATNEMREQRYFGGGSSGPELSLVYYYNGPNNPSTTSTQKIRLKFNFPQLSGLTMSSPSIEALTNNSVSFSWNRPTQINETIAIRNAVSSRTFYNIYQKSESGEVNELTAKRITGFANSEESCVINGLQADSRFCFGVRAVGDGLYYGSSTNLAVISGYTMALYNEKFTSRSQLPSGTNRLKQDRCSVETSITGITGLEVDTDYKVDINLESDGVYHVSSQTINRIARTPNGGGVEWATQSLTFRFYETSNNPKKTYAWFYNLGSPACAGDNGLYVRYNDVQGEENKQEITIYPTSVNTDNSTRTWNIYFYDEDGDSVYTQLDASSNTFTVQQEAASQTVTQNTYLYFTDTGYSYRQKVEYGESGSTYINYSKEDSYFTEVTYDSGNIYVTAKNIDDGVTTVLITIYSYKNDVLYKTIVHATLHSGDDSDVLYLKQSNGSANIIDFVGNLSVSASTQGYYCVYYNTGDIGDTIEEFPEIVLDNNLTIGGTPIEWSKLKAELIISRYDGDDEVYAYNGYRTVGTACKLYIDNVSDLPSLYTSDVVKIRIWYEVDNVFVKNNTFNYLVVE